MAKRIVILGAGVAGAQVIKHVHNSFHHDQDVSLTVIDRNNYSAFVPMLHEAATGSVQMHDLTYPIRQIIQCCLEHFHQANVEAIDLEQRIIKTSQGEVYYDYLVVALGADNNFFNVPGAAEHCLTLKTMQDAVRLRNHLIDAFEEVAKLHKQDLQRKAKLNFVIVGAGYTGVEIAGQLADLFKKEFRDFYPEIHASEPKITIVQAVDRILPIFKEKNSRKAHYRLEKLGVEILTNTKVTSVTSEGVCLDNGRVIPSHSVIWASGIKARGSQFFSEEMLHKSRVKVKSTLQLFDHPEVFVLGDLAAVMEGNGPHPQTAQVAFEQAKVVGENMTNLINYEPLKAFHYKHKGDLVVVGNNWAIAEIKGIAFTGFPAWWLRRIIYLQGLFSWSDRIRTIFDWIMNLFTKRDTTRL